jgi:hypothetical protein
MHGYIKVMHAEDGIQKLAKVFEFDFQGFL